MEEIRYKQQLINNSLDNINYLRQNTNYFNWNLYNCISNYYINNAMMMNYINNINNYNILGNNIQNLNNFCIYINNQIISLDNTILEKNSTINNNNINDIHSIITIKN